MRHKSAKIVGVLTLICLFLAACQGLAPSPDIQLEAPSLPGITPAVDSLWKFGWLSVLLVFIFPGIRVPLVTLWTTILRCLAIPFAWARSKFDSNTRN
jgi:hypothetical protein